MDQAKIMLTTREFSEKTGLSFQLVKRLAKQGRLVCVKTGYRYYIDYPASMDKLWVR